MLLKVGRDSRWEDGGFILGAQMEEWYPEKEIVRSKLVALAALTCLCLYSSELRCVLFGMQFTDF